MLIGFQDWENKLLDFVEEVIQQILVAIVNFDHCLMIRCYGTMRIVEEVEVDWLLGKGLRRAFEVILLHPAVGGEGRHPIWQRWRLERAERGDG